MIIATTRRVDIIQKQMVIQSKSLDEIAKKTDYLVYGEKAGSKLAKAEQLGVETLDADAFLKLVGPR